MSEEKDKLSSDQVPEKLSEWLLAMGCPAENVPSFDSAKQMCRGQYYVVWRSLMDEVEPKDAIKYKRLTVFTDDIRKCQEKNVFNETNISVIVPDVLSIWSQHVDLKRRVSEGESRIMQAKQDLQQLIDKVSSKLAQRNLTLHQVQDVERRVLFLQKYLEDLQNKKSDLQETMSIANSLSCNEDNGDAVNKLDKCVSAMRGGNTRPQSSNSLLSAANPVACSSVFSVDTENDCEELVWSLVRCRGDALWAQLHERRAGLCLALSHACVRENAGSRGVSARSVVAHSAALHSTIALEALKNKALITHARTRLAAAVTQLSDYLSGDACEYLVVNCERSRAQSRVLALRQLSEELRARAGPFRGERGAGAGAAGGSGGRTRAVAARDKAIVCKKEELKRSLQSLARMERKILNVRDCLRAVFNCFQNRVKPADMEKFKAHITLPQDSINTLQQFYEERRLKQNKLELSLDLDISGNNSAIDPTDKDNPKLVDELKLYLDKFKLEKNRKLVLESGDKIWIFETIESCLRRLQKRWLTEELPCKVICPSVSLAANLHALESCVMMRNELAVAMQAVRADDMKFVGFDVSSQKLEENEATDKIKKRLNENIVNLHKINRTLDLGAENLKFWAANEMKNYIKCNRTMDGKTYKEYEKYYLDCLRI